MSKEVVLEVRNVSKTYAQGDLSVDVLRDVSFKIYEGERVAIVGASGSGKSTLLHLLGGLEPPTSGQVVIKNVDINRLAARALGHFRSCYVGFIYQFHHLLPEFTAFENVCMPLRIQVDAKQTDFSAEQGQSWLMRKLMAVFQVFSGVLIWPLKAVAQRRRIKRALPSIFEKANTVLSLVGLSQRQHHKPAEMSGGERQRAAIARALVAEPACILADEPTGNLDWKNSDQIYDLMLNLNKTHQTSFIVVTHDQALANRMDRVLRIEEGCLVEVERA